MGQFSGMSCPVSPEVWLSPRVSQGQHVCRVPLEALCPSLLSHSASWDHLENKHNCPRCSLGATSVEKFYTWLAFAYRSAASPFTHLFRELDWPEFPEVPCGVPCFMSSLLCQCLLLESSWIERRKPPMREVLFKGCDPKGSYKTHC